MSESPHRTAAATATATLDSGIGKLYSVHIKAGADAATAVFRTGGSGGTVIAAIGAGIGLLYSVQLRAIGDAATAVFRTGGSGGTIIAALAAATATSVNHTFAGAIVYSNLHVTITGTTPNAIAEI